MSTSPPLAARLKPAAVPVGAAADAVRATPRHLSRPQPSSAVAPPPSPVVASPVVPELPAAIPASAPAVLALPGGASGLDAAGLRWYRIALAQQLRESMRAFAAEAAGTKFFARNGHEHVHLSVQLSFAAGGQLLAVNGRGSDGAEIVNPAWLSQVRAAASRVQLPDSLRGQAITLDLQFEF